MLKKAQVLALACGLSGPVLARADARVLDRVVAVVDDRALTLSDLEFETAIALIQRGAMGAATQPLDTEALASAVDLAVAQRVASDEAEKFQAFPVEDAELQAAVQGFAARFPSPKAYERFLSRFDRDETQLGVVLARGLRAEKLIDSRVRLRSQVQDADVRRYYEEHAAELGAPYERVRAAIGDRLARERYLALAGAEIQQLVHGPNVRRVFIPGSAP